MRLKEIKLATTDEAIAALYATHLISNDNKAIVMVKGFGGDYDEYNAVYWSEYVIFIEDMEADELKTAAAEFFSGWEDYQLWIDEWLRIPHSFKNLFANASASAIMHLQIVMDG